MIRRAFAALSLLILILALAPATHAAAHRTALKGQAIDGQVTISGQTGACACMKQWYTIGFKPGKVAIRGQLKACGDQGQPYCFMVVTLLRGPVTLKTVSVQCPSKASRCNRSWSINYRVKAAGAYYLQVQGEVGLTMNYTLRPSGNIYRLHCARYC